MKTRFMDFINESKQDLGLGILKDKINIIKWGNQLTGSEYYEEFTSLYSIPNISIKTKRELVNFTNSLSKEDIKNGYIVIYGQETLSLNLSDFKNEIELTDINSIKLGHTYYVDDATEKKEEFIINRKRYTFDELKNIIKK